MRRLVLASACGFAALFAACDRNDPLGPGGAGPRVPELPQALLMPIPGFTALTVGTQHSCALAGDGTIHCWGYGGAGQLTDVPTEAGFTRVSAGGSYTCALSADGGIRCWGNNDFGQLNGVPTEAGFTQISVGEHHSCALDADGSIRCWGAGQLDGVPADRGFTRLSAGYPSSCALRSDGTVRCWAEWAQSGMPTEPGFTALAASASQMCALDGDGKIRCWGGRQPDGVPAEGGFTELIPGGLHMCALGSTGTVRCWGDNNFHGQLNGTPTEPGFTQLSAGVAHTCALASDGRVRCWGGNGGEALNGVPTEAGFKSVVTSPFSAAHTCALDSDGAIRCWGNNRLGQLNGIPSTRVFPVATLTAESPVAEGSAFLLSLTDAHVPGVVGTPLEYAFHCGDGAGQSAFGPSSQRSCATGDDGARAVSGTVRDRDGDQTAYAGEVIVRNVAPTVGAISASIDPVAVGTGITLDATFTDPGTQDTHTATVDWGDGSSSSALISESNGSGSAAPSHAYATPGVYTLVLTVTDDDGGSGSAVFQYVVVYDPAGGFVTGGGSITSPAGAYAADPSLTGKATFGFVSRYLKGATAPSGSTEFQFHAGDLRFKSASYDWLLVAGARAQFKGTGTINGAGHFGFLLTAVDGQVSGGGGSDKFRIKIWDRATGAVLYDNQMGDADDANVTAIASGSIVIHAR